MLNRKNIPYKLSSTILKEFIKSEKIVMESAKSNIPSIVHFIVGHDFKGSWWGLPYSSLIYNTLVELRSWEEILVCRLIKRKITYVDYDILPFLIRLADEFPSEGLYKIKEIHTAQGSHRKQIFKLNESLSTADLFKRSIKLSRNEAIDSLIILMPKAEIFFKEIGIKI